MSCGSKSNVSLLPRFLAGGDRTEVYEAVGAVANRWLQIIDSKGSTLTDKELIYLISERVQIV
jgi:hypothetical protein